MGRGCGHIKGFRALLIPTTRKMYTKDLWGPECLASSKIAGCFVTMLFDALIDKW